MIDMHIFMRRLAHGFLLAATVAVAPVLAKTAATPVATPTAGAISCEALGETDFTGIPDAATVVMSAKLVPTGNGLPAHCQLSGVIQPQIQFDLRLPTETWNGRYLQLGCGGYCGFINVTGCDDALAKDFVVAAHNMGHVGTAAGAPLWAQDPQLRRDYADRSTHVMSVVAKTIAARYYGAAPHHAYFRGCSTGGREGLMEAQRFPDDFDGIIAGDPAFPVRQGAIVNNWDMRQLLRPDGSAVFDVAKLKVLHEAVMAQCDVIDGVRDGILMDPRLCKFDVHSLQCKGADAGACLTAEQVSVALKLYDGPRNSRGERLGPSHREFGTELAWDDPGKLRLGFSEGFVWLGPEQNPAPGHSFRDFDFDNSMAVLEPMALLYDPVAPHKSPDLSAFHDRGGKLVVTHGYADPTVPPSGTLDYYARVSGDHGGLRKTQDWFRVFMVPGMFHCRGGDAPNTFDFLDALVAWVEQDQAPQSVVATQRDAAGKVIRTRPLVPYPAVAHYRGKGDVNDAANWDAKTPAKLSDDRMDWIWAPEHVPVR